MAKGDFDANQLRGMGQTAANAQMDPYTKATNALRVRDQITASELQFCIAFGLDPFSYLAAKLAETDAIAAERQARIASDEFHDRYYREREAQGAAEIERLRNL